MTTRHLVTEINTLLTKDTKFLSDFFDGNGKAIKKELQRLKNLGHIYIGSEGCNTFDPVKGCQCHLKNQDGTAN